MTLSNDVSIPFIAGQWSLRAEEMFSKAKQRKRFNPLHCGAVVASGVHPTHPLRLGGVSIPFIAGQWSLRPSTRSHG